MNRRLMQESKAIAFTTIKQNIWKILFILILADMPPLFCNIAIASLLPITDAVTLSMEELITASYWQLFAQLGIFLVALIFFPISAAATKLYFNMLYQKPANINELFENYGSFKRLFSCFSLYLQGLIKAFFRILPCFFFLGLAGFIYGMSTAVMSYMVLLIPFYIVIFIVIFYALGRVMLSTLFVNISILNLDNENYSRKAAYKELKLIYKHRTKELSNLALNFVGIGIVAVFLSTFTLSISLFIFSIYYNLSITYYTLKYNPQFLPININSQEENYGQ